MSHRGREQVGDHRRPVPGLSPRPAAPRPRRRRSRFIRPARHGRTQPAHLRAPLRRQPGSPTTRSRTRCRGARAPSSVFECKNASVFRSKTGRGRGRVRRRRRGRRFQEFRGRRRRSVLVRGKSTARRRGATRPSRRRARMRQKRRPDQEVAPARAVSPKHGDARAAQVGAARAAASASRTCRVRGCPQPRTGTRLYGRAVGRAPPGFARAYDAPLARPPRRRRSVRAAASRSNGPDRRHRRRPANGRRKIARRPQPAPPPADRRRGRGAARLAAAPHAVRRPRTRPTARRGRPMAEPPTRTAPPSPSTTTTTTLPRAAHARVARVALLGAARVRPAAAPGRRGRPPSSSARIYRSRSSPEMPPLSI